jgi:predicted amidophosphoribosyltransferase
LKEGGYILKQGEMDFFMGFPSVFNHLICNIKNILYPPQCPGCYGIISENRMFCPSCWEKVSLIQDPMCRQCGFPFEPFATEDLFQCAKCMINSPFFDECRGLWSYEGIVPSLMMSFKHGDGTFLSPFLI